jgi:hypothetical protein
MLGSMFPQMWLTGQRMPFLSFCAIILFPSFSTGDWAWGILLARKALSYLSHTHCPFALGYFSDRVSGFCVSCPQIMIMLLLSAFQAAGITNMCHHTWLCARIRFEWFCSSFSCSSLWRLICYWAVRNSLSIIFHECFKYSFNCQCIGNMQYLNKKSDWLYMYVWHFTCITLFNHSNNPRVRYYYYIYLQMRKVKFWES